MFDDEYDDEWGHVDRGQRARRASFHHGFIVKRSKKSDRQRFNIRTVHGTEFSDVQDTQHIGFTSNPKPGDNVEVMVAEVGGDASRMIIIAKFGDQEKVLQVEEGAMAIYSPDAPSNKIVIQQDGTIEIFGGKELKAEVPKCVVNCPDINLGGEGGKPVAIEGTITSDGAKLVSAFATRVKAV